MSQFRVSLFHLRFALFIASLRYYTVGGVA